MTFEALLPSIVGFAVIYVPMIIFIGYELWRVDDDGNIISELKVYRRYHLSWNEKSGWDFSRPNHGPLTMPYGWL